MSETQRHGGQHLDRRLKTEPAGARHEPAGRVPVGRAIELRIGLAAAALGWERLWPSLAPAAGLIGLFLALALLGAPQVLGGRGHLAVLLVFAIAIPGALAWGLHRFRRPDRNEAIRRLERDSGLHHRPLSSLGDRLAGEADPAMAELWRQHRQRLAGQLRQLRVALPHPNLAARDPLALRALVILLLVVAAIGTRGQWGGRVARALAPDLSAVGAAAAVALDIWVTPPDYTGLPPVFLKPVAHGAPRPGPLAIPAGSTVMARVNGADGQPRLQINGDSAPFKRVDAKSFEISHTITGGDRLAVEQGGSSLGSWPITVVADQPPQIEFVRAPSASERGALRIDYRALDDYGVVKVAATLQLDGAAAGLTYQPAGQAPMTIALPVPPAPRGQEIRSTSYNDLTAHPWAGLPVTITLTATDGAGHSSSTQPVHLVMPERHFTHPVARAIIDARRLLTLRGERAREEVARMLFLLTTRPDRFGDDTLVYLGLRGAVDRLELDGSPQAITAIQALLWDLALRVEDRGVSLAERNLRNAEQALMDGLDRGASDQEIARLMDQLQAALDQFLNTLEEQMRQALARGERVPMIAPDSQAQMLSRDDLRQMLQRMRDMAMTGSRDAARQMLSQLEQMLENLRAGAMAQMQPGQGTAAQAMQQLQGLARRQQELLDRSFRDAQNGNGDDQGEGESAMPGEMPNRQGRPDGSGSPGQNPAADQLALRRQLGDLMRRLGEGGTIPRPLGQAERAMREAEQALGQGQPGMAVPSQTRALDQLQQGMQALAEQMAQQAMSGNRNGNQPGQGPLPRDARDPLGRLRDDLGQEDGSSVTIPDASELQRARQILDELRRRAGEFDRPKLELDYIERLLRQF